MNKREFLETLTRLAAALPEEERTRLLEYYAEIIDDRTEEGLSEAEAVAALGDPQALAEGLGDVPRAVPADPSAETVPSMNALSIRVLNADVTVTCQPLSGGAAAQLRFSDPARFRWHMEGDTMHIEERQPEGPRFSIQRVLGLLASPRLRLGVTLAGDLADGLEFTAEGGDLTIRNVTTGGTAILDSTSGDITLARCTFGGGLQISARSGDLKLDKLSLNGPTRLHTANGDIVATGLAAEDLRLFAASGDIELKNVTCADLAMETASGDIESRQIHAATTNIHTSSGDIELNAVQADPTLQVQSASGDIDMKRCIARQTALKATSGDVDLRLAALPCGYALSAHSVSGDVRLPEDNPPVRQGVMQPVIDIHTTSGDIEVSIQPD